MNRREVIIVAEEEVNGVRGRKVRAHIVSAVDKEVETEVDSQKSKNSEAV